MTSTTITAIPKPMAVCTFFEIARNVHIPRKKASAMFSTKIALTARLISCSMIYTASFLVFGAISKSGFST
jgi:hypothetical protein